MLASFGVDRSGVDGSGVDRSGIDRSGVDRGPPAGRVSPLACEAPAGSDDPYWAFYAEVAGAQLAAWLPAEPARVLDVSGPRGRFTRQLVARGHDVVRVVADSFTPRVDARGPGRVRHVVGDSRTLDWIAPAAVDAVLAEGRALSYCLATDTALEQIHRALRPGGRLLLSVDSLLLGLARLAEQHRWAELADAPSADVVLVPAEDGTITRCFWPEELHALLTGAGFEVDWVRPRTVLSAEAVNRAVSEDVTCFPTLVRTEVELSAEREGESIGIHLVASAHRR